MVHGCSCAPNSQVAEEDISHFYKQERKCPTPMRRRLSRTQAPLGRVIPRRCVAVFGFEVRSVVRPLHVTLMIRPLRRTYVVVVRGTDELLCSGYKRVSRFEASFFYTLWAR